MSPNNTERKEEEDVIQSTIGNFGRWQFTISILMALLKFPIAWFQLSIVFLAPPTEFWCKPHENSINISRIDWWNNHMSNNFIKREGLNTGFCNTLSLNSSNSTIPCAYGMEYNTTIFRSSIVTEWDLVCDKKRLIDISQITLMLGVLIGNIFCGVYADRHGRKKILMICILLQAIFGIVASWVPWFSVFLIFRFLLAIANGGTIVTSFVMCMEVVGGVWRSIIPILYQIPFGFGTSIMAGLAYTYKDWRDLQLAISILSSFYVLYIWFVPESPRWLIAVGERDKAIKILQKAALCNRMDPKKVLIAIGQPPSEDLPKTNKKLSISVLFSTKELRKRTILLCLNWLIGGMTFYAFSQYAGKIARNIYFTTAISGFVAFPGTIVCVYVVLRFGRRWTIALAYLLTAICFFGILFFPTGVYPQDWPRVVMGGIGIIGLSVAVPAFYLFTGELYPTTVRNAGVGLALMFSRLGSMVAPLVITMQDISPPLPLIVLGGCAVIEMLLVLPLPETKGAKLLETIEDLVEDQKFKDERLSLTDVELKEMEDQ